MSVHTVAQTGMCCVHYNNPSLGLQSVMVQEQGIRQLPIAIEDTYIYQEAQMLMIESARGFSMQCNLKFDVCTFTLSGKTTFSYFYSTEGKSTRCCVAVHSTVNKIMPK
jgi:hypothetical protein